MGGEKGVAFSTGSTPGLAVCVTAGADAQEAAGSYVQAQGK